MAIEGTRAPLLGEPLPVELMNTLWADRDGVHDALADGGDAASWLAAVAARIVPNLSAGSDPVTAIDAGFTDSAAYLAMSPDVLSAFAARLREVRDGARSLAATVTADPRLSAESGTVDRVAALDALNRACQATPTWSRLDWPPSGEPTRTLCAAASPPDVAIGWLAEQTVALFGSPQRTNLRACLAPHCVLYFVKEHPRREWCSAGCGNRARVARHYERHRSPGS